MNERNEVWPDLTLDEWEPTYATLHRWTQIVGKIRLTQAPWVNHSWHVPLYVTARGLTTTSMPHGHRSFEITFDFCAHQLLIHTSDGTSTALPLRAQSVADFHAELMVALEDLGVGVVIHGRPNELEDNTPFAEDRLRSAYDPAGAERFWRALVQADRVLQQFRARFIGKCSPVHFFWGSFDLAVTRFSGRTAPPHPGGVPNLPDVVAREAYSHEVSSCGFWPGGGPHPYPLFYSYAYPQPEGFASAAVGPEGAVYSDALREWILPYDDVRRASSPDDALMTFLETTYEAAATLASWDREALEQRSPPAAALPPSAHPR